MLRDKEPWIVTDVRVPCLVVEGEISGAADMDKINAELKAAFVNFDDVYNRAAYKIDNGCEVAFCVSMDFRAALLFFGRDATANGDPATALMERIRAQEEKIQSFFTSRKIGTVRFDRFGLEMTGRNPS